MSTAFAATERQNILKAMAAETHDILIIGGGITGVGTAWDASRRGMKTALIEMKDFAWGTSSRSTKLVHGGLRYLKQGEVKLVMEVGRERALLHRNAPHIVIPAPMMLPIYKGGSMGYFMSSIGLYVYDMLAGVKRKERRIMYRVAKTQELEPLFKKKDMIGSGYYYEYRTDDARLTMEVAKCANRNGAKLVNYAQAGEFLYKNGRVIGVNVTDVTTGEEYKIYAKKIVNAAGPWVDRVRGKDHEVKGKKLLLTKGVHLVVDHSRLPVKQAAYFDVPDGRMIFVIPRDGKTYMGTTDTFYKDAIEEPRTTVEDRDYLLNACNNMFPDVKLTPDDVESMWAGLRPLIHEDGKKPSEVSRKDEIFLADSGLITIAGGKLTGFRKMAEKVVDLVAKQIGQEEGRSFPGCTTDQEVLSGGSTDGKSYEAYKKQIEDEGIRLGLSPKHASYLYSRYGSNTPQIHAGIREMAGEQALSTDQKALIAEVDYCIQNEMTVTAVDFLVRRTGLLLFNVKRAKEIAPSILHLLADRLGWSEAELKLQQDRLEKEFETVKATTRKDSK
ncbi:aerobic glycerol-3-phosphate dehydrogenase [Paenibacillus sp. J31TS4]|uniref:glycerol-3-phosphate dehydrogenase/oxidase n=1 Tax=Paenibacillus sp. J31TS4 TaxID=2807195 RepID=UPI001B1D4AF4|nr:glycerol-3-phosphate dehydrogenase/oxidase [Paenibacillus sp. J31TS4]GIP41065.1 aerobic glycerol-3-phosphate dehydrogenase [Paenibacillus sp. J31TS4]